MTRQYRWQLKKKLQGKCIICGKRKTFKDWRCKKHYLKKLELQKLRYKKHKEAKT